MLKDIFNIKKGSIVSIVGSGGKTSLLFFLAAELKQNYSVLVTTSTKILKPSVGKYDYLYTNIDSFINSKLTKENNVTVISKSINEENNKLVGIDDGDLEKLLNNFDVILIEADGSRNLPLKGWKDHEPPVLIQTNKTIGVIPIGVLGREIDESFIYGYEEFKKFIGDSKYIKEEIIKNICISKEGLFKNSTKERCLFINQADEEHHMEKAIKLAKYLRSNIESECFKIVVGSLHKDTFYEY